MNTHNIYEFIYIIIGSSISHAVVVLYIIYIIFDKFILQENEKNIADQLIDYVSIYQVDRSRVCCETTLGSLRISATRSCDSGSEGGNPATGNGGKGL